MDIIDKINHSPGVLDAKTRESIKRIIDALPYYVLLVDSEHKIQLCNSPVNQTLGLHSRDIIGQYCPKLIHHSDSPIPQCPLEEAVAKDCAIERDYYDEGFGRWLSSAIYPTSFKSSQGKTIYFHTVRNITDEVEAKQQLEASLIKLKQITSSVIKTLTITVEKRDPYTAGHQLRVSLLAVKIAEKLGLSTEEIEGIKVASLLHDVGKIAVPIEILSKPGKISIHEYSIIQDHPQIGYDIVKEIEFPWPVAEMILQHHERLNGTGYPNGLRGNEISLGAKIICVADVVEAMMSHRPYRQALGKETALNELKINKNILYDKDVVDACFSIFSEGFDF